MELMFKRIYIFFVFAYSFAAGPERIATIEECRNKIGVTRVDAFNVVVRHMVPDNRKQACLLACTLKKTGFLGEDNKMDMKVITEYFEHMKDHNVDLYNNLTKIHTDCKLNESAEDDECKAAQKYAECVFPKNQILFDPPHHDGKRHMVVEECKNKTSATDEDVMIVMRHQIPQTKNAQCMMACMEKKIGNMKSDNKFDYERLKQKYNHFKHHDEEIYESAISILDSCKDTETAEEDECKAAKKYAECVYTKENAMRPMHLQKRGAVQECRNTTGVTNDEYWSAGLRIPKSKSEQCFLACIYKQAGIIGKDHQFHVDRIRHGLRLNEWRHPHTINNNLEIYEKCKPTDESDECAAVKIFIECTFKEQEAATKKASRK